MKRTNLYRGFAIAIGALFLFTASPALARDAHATPPPLASGWLAELVDSINARGQLDEPVAAEQVRALLERRPELRKRAERLARAWAVQRLLAGHELESVTDTSDALAARIPGRASVNPIQGTEESR